MKEKNFSQGSIPSYNLLSEREQQVFKKISEGLSNKEISQNLFISHNTVKTHIKNIYSKLGVTSRSHAILKAFENK